MSGLRIALLYGAFAILAVLANLGVQRLILSFGSGLLLFASALFAGTLIGLLVKYLLDKRWIFHDHRQGLRHHGQKFTLYSAMGLVTTAIFWGMESSFWLVWKTDQMRELGAVIGLVIGYLVKYRLDRRFVFGDVPPQDVPRQTADTPPAQEPLA